MQATSITRIATSLSAWKQILVVITVAFLATILSIWPLHTSRYSLIQGKRDTMPPRPVENVSKTQPNRADFTFHDGVNSPFSIFVNASRSGTIPARQHCSRRPPVYASFGVAQTASPRSRSPTRRVAIACSRLVTRPRCVASSIAMPCVWSSTAHLCVILSPHSTTFRPPMSTWRC